MSRLAAAAIRGLVTGQLTVILASSGQTRWCELATAAPGAAEPFLQVFPDARFVCVHRSCLDVIRAGVQASPWGLQAQGLTPYLLAYPGNSVAALAAYWATSAEQLIAFEEANRAGSPPRPLRGRHRAPGQALATVRAVPSGLATRARRRHAPLTALFHQSQTEPSEPLAKVPDEMIPQPLRQRISRLHAQLGYPSPER